MNNLKLNFVNKSTNPDPEYAYKGDSGFDLRAWIKDDETSEKYDGQNCITLKPLERRLIHTGIYIEIPYNTEIQVRAKSGMSLKKGLGVLNGPATIDSNYTGEINVISVNLSNEDIIIKNGDKIAQCVLVPVYNENFVTLVSKDSIEDNTERGSKGFGSSGER